MRTAVTHQTNVPWVDALYSGDSDDEAIDLLFVHMDNLLCAGRYDQVDIVLSQLDCDRMSSTLIVATLSCTKRARNRLKARSAFRERAATRLHEIIPDRADRVLVNL